jgi:predicted O-linked N-acetylglucosamine transferase (SPINDLY family)
LPVFEYLDRSQFEIILYAIDGKNQPLEQYCQSRGDRLVTLPENIHDQVKQIRSDDLDILFIGMNIVTRLRERGLLEFHRLARVQTTSFCSPITTRMRHIDYYIAGALTAPAPTYQNQYREQLVNIPGSGICFRFPTEHPPATVKPDRQSWGATSESIVFISGANFHKIIPELRETWAKIIAAVPNSILVLYPFGPAWNPNYPAIPFINLMRAVFSKYGIDSNRLVFINTLPSPADIKECLKIADIYLDSYPYAGATSLIDPLEIGLPPIVWEGNTLRSRQGSALLQELQIPQLIVNSETAYINLAVTLANSRQLRQQYRQQIQQKMQTQPPFLDSRSYSAKMGKLFQQLFQTWQGQQKSVEIESLSLESNPLLQQVTTTEFINRAIGCANLYYIDPTDQSITEELRQIRRQIAEFWLNTVPEQLQHFYQSHLGQAYQKLVRSNLKQEPLTPTEQTFVQQLANELMLGMKSPKAINYFLAAQLYRPVQIPPNTQGIPDWLVL